jgi:hypothetical protein
MGLVTEHVRLNRATKYGALALTACVGVFSFHIRMVDAKDKSDLIHVHPEVSDVFIDGCHHQLLYKAWGENISVEFFGFNAEKSLESGKTILLISQDVKNSIQKNIENWSRDQRSIDVLEHQVVNTGIQFLAYSPKQYAWDRQSGFEAMTFKVKSNN